MQQYREQSQIVGVFRFLTMSPPQNWVSTSRRSALVADTSARRVVMRSLAADSAAFYDCTEKLTSPPMATAPAAMIDSNHCHRPLPLPVAVIICHIYSL